MVYRLRKKFIRICMFSFLAAFVAFLIIFYASSSLRMDNQVDSLVDIIVDNNGTFPAYENIEPLPEDFMSENLINPDSPFTTRYFTVWINADGTTDRTDTAAITRISDKEAAQYAARAQKKNGSRGWIDSYRYRKYTALGKSAITFVDGSVQQTMSYNFWLTGIIIFAVGSIAVLFLVIFISRYAVKPVAESYEKQKQFITDANHELKTPLTLIMTNVDIVEAEVGPNEWLDDIRSEGQQMSSLIRRLISLARMDEEKMKPEMADFNISDTVLEYITACEGPALERGLSLNREITPDLSLSGNEENIRQLLSILLDNAFKYCDAGGKITVTLREKKAFPVGKFFPFLKYLKKGRCQTMVLTIDNSFAAVDSQELDRLFDRFYRSDAARTMGDGFGIGLSIARSIVEKHQGTIKAENLNHQAIRFRVEL